MASDSTTRFSSRVGDYVRYRPDYPSDAFELLERECGLGPGMTVADVGAGTGISTRQILSTGARVIAVEPNAAMGSAIEATLHDNPRLSRGDGTAEATGLPDASVDLVTAFQAFHWFDRAAARREFKRILRPEGSVALVWNERLEDATPFLRGYEALLREYAGDYMAVRHNAITQDDLQAWFGGTMKVATFPKSQRFDFEGVLGRLMSSSYAPQTDSLHHAPMAAALRRLFEDNAEEGRVEFRYETRVYHGRFASSGESPARS